MTILKACLTTALVIAAIAAALGPAEAKDAATTQEMIAKIVAVDLAAKSIRVESGTGPSEVLFAVATAVGAPRRASPARCSKLTVRIAMTASAARSLRSSGAKSDPKPWRRRTQRWPLRGLRGGPTARSTPSDWSASRRGDRRLP
jgi:hypothetical protein